MMTTKHKSEQGFSLIEVIIYVAIVSVVAVGFMYFAIDVTGTAQKSEVQLNVQQGARFALQRILQETRESSGLNAGSSVFGSNPGTLSLQSPVPSDDPVVFDVVDGVLRMKKGAGSPEPITPSTLEVSEFTLTNLTISGRTESIHVRLTLRHPNPQQSGIFDAETTLEGSAVIRR